MAVVTSIVHPDCEYSLHLRHTVASHLEVVLDISVLVLQGSNACIGVQTLQYTEANIYFVHAARQDAPWRAVVVLAL